MTNATTNDDFLQLDSTPLMVWSTYKVALRMFEHMRGLGAKDDNGTLQNPVAHIYGLLFGAAFLWFGYVFGLLVLTAAMIEFPDLDRPKTREKKQPTTFERIVGPVDQRNRLSLFILRSLYFFRHLVEADPKYEVHGPYAIDGMLTRRDHIMGEFGTPRQITRSLGWVATFFTLATTAHYAISTACATTTWTTTILAPTLKVIILPCCLAPLHLKMTQALITTNSHLNSSSSKRSLPNTYKILILPTLLISISQYLTYKIHISTSQNSVSPSFPPVCKMTLYLLGFFQPFTGLGTHP
ncbi:hypothetical protein Slin15195_G101260 [Septoria linicola]|uniref:Uncharacterized protein n=1 Tax=Septoria linicola TaxID=215465 RepID=A0A9Q9ENN1_9PEZI|nr:hypothetical protein Slin15195_G101260 [Septoria linicola]